MKPRFFATPTLFRNWLGKNDGRVQELWVGFHKRASGRPSITWPEAVDAALCYGWIDGVRKSLDENSYTIRFTPRKARSTWSAVNIRRARQLTRMGLMQPSGRKAFQQRNEENSRKYSYEQRQSARLPRAYEQTLRANEKAWKFFQGQAPWYRRTASFWVVSAKQEETRLKRLGRLIADSEQGRTIAPLSRPQSK